jgi:hypothetical protein
MKTLSKIITLASGITMLFASSVCYAGGPGAFAHPGRSHGVGRIQRVSGGGGSGGGGISKSGGSSGREDSPGPEASPACPSGAWTYTPSRLATDIVTGELQLSPVEDQTTTGDTTPDGCTTAGGSPVKCPPDDSTTVQNTRRDAAITGTWTFDPLADGCVYGGWVYGDSPAGDSASSDEPVNVADEDSAYQTIVLNLNEAIGFVQGEIDDLRATETSKKWPPSVREAAIMDLVALRSHITNVRTVVDALSAGLPPKIHGRPTTLKSVIDSAIDMTSATFFNGAWRGNEPKYGEHGRAGASDVQVVVHRTLQKVLKWAEPG